MKLKGEGGLYPKKCAKKLLIDQASVIAKSSKQNYVGKLTTKDDGTRNKIDMFQGFTSVKVGYAQNKRRRIGLKKQAEESIYYVMNESGSAYDLASGTNPIVDNCDDEEDIFLQPGSDIGQQLLDPPLSY